MVCHQPGEEEQAHGHSVEWWSSGCVHKNTSLIKWSVLLLYPELASMGILL